MPKKVTPLKKNNSKSSGGHIPDYTLQQWGGINTAVKDTRQLKMGISPNSLNWITGRYGDYIELRRGSALLGTTRNTGTGSVTGMGVATRFDGTQVPFFSYLRKVKYYNSTTNDTAEVGSDMLPAAASGEFVSFSQYQNLAGSFMYLTSQNSSIYKIPAANPANAVDQQIQSYKFKFMKINQGRMFGIQRRGLLANSKDDTGVYLSYIDKSLLSLYPSQTVDEILGSGNGATKAFSGSSLALASGPNTIFNAMIGSPIAAAKVVSAITAASAAQVTANGHGYVVGDFVIILGITGMTQMEGRIATVVSVVDANNFKISVDSTSFSAFSATASAYKIECFTDDRNGSLNSNLGGTGTINYATGAWSVTFNTAPINLSNGIIANYYEEDATNQGVCDFSLSSPRTAGQGDQFRQDDGGGTAMAIFPLETIEYCFHLLKTWQISITNTDTSATNLPYREHLGIPYPLAAYPSDTGIYFLNNYNPSQPMFMALKIISSSTGTTVLPENRSEQLDLSVNDFTSAVVFRWGDYDILSCKNIRNGIPDNFNGITYIRNINSGFWDILDYEIACLSEYAGTLISGDSLSNNLFTLFSGYDDDGNVIANYRDTAPSDLGLEGVKKYNRIVMEGLIQISQSIDVYGIYDGGNPIKLFTINGNGTYVSKGSPTTVGSYTVGSKVVGGGGGNVIAFPYNIDFAVASDRFEYVALRFVANNVGFARVSKVVFKDIRYKGRHLSSTQTSG